MTWSDVALQWAVRRGSPGESLIKGEVARKPSDGLVPGYSASGQDVWLDRAQFRGPGLIVSAVGARCGKVFQTDGEWGVVANTAVLVPQAGYEPRFLWYVLNREDFWEKGGTAQPYVLVGETLRRRVPMPPLEVQRRIADYLDSETARIDRLRHRNEALSRLARERHERFVLASVTEGTAADAPSRAVEGHWFTRCSSSFDIGSYAMYGRTGSGHTPSRSVAEYWTDCHIPWITTGDVQQLRPGYVEYIDDTSEKISEMGMANSAARLHPAGTVVLSRTASVGFAGIMSVPMATSQDFFTWTPVRARLRPDYLLWALRAMRYAGHFDRLMYGSTHKTIYVPDLMVLRGPVPPVDEQDRIVSAIREQRDETIALVDKLERANQLLTERREALIDAVVTGDREV